MALAKKKMRRGAGNARAVDGSPTKAFFVRMITRDITLEDCILDLIDNSIDGAWQLAGGMPADLSAQADLSNYKIDVLASEDTFSITDNCGGIASNEAKEHAFTFGRNNDEYEDYSIGVYGIGMKRAVFKIGRQIEVTSTHLSDDGNIEAFVVPIDVAEWIGRPDPKDWNFGLYATDPLPERGVRIVIDDLTPRTRDSFGSPTFIQNLRRMIARDYTLHLRHGIVITLNGQAIRGWPIELKTGSDIEPVRLTYDDSNLEGEVRVEIVAGMAAPPPDDIDPEDVGEDDRFGWYVACNGRIVLAADKGEASGWGTDQWPSWHGQYNGFIGLIVFTSEKAAALPLTTTKRSVDLSSEIFRRARPRMRQVSRDWIDYTNTRKQAREEAGKREQTAASVPIQSVAKRQALQLPTLRPVAKKEPEASISYRVPLVKFTALARALGDINMKRGELGKATFDYVYKYEVDG